MIYKKKNLFTILQIRLLPIVLIGSSAIMLSLALFSPEKMYFLVFIFLIPIFYAANKNIHYISFGYGFLWGALFFTTQFVGFVALFYKETNASYGISKVGIPIFLAFYCAFYAGFWFFLAQKSIRILYYFFYTFYPKKFFLIASIPLILWTFLFFNWVRYGILWIFGEFVGYPLAYPLLPLMCNSTCILLLRYVGKSIFFLLIILFSFSISWIFVFFKKKYFYIISIFSCLFLSNISIQKFLKYYTPPFGSSLFSMVKKMGYISPIGFQKFSSPLDIAQEIYYNIVSLLEKNPNITTIFMPESSYPFCLNQNQDIIDLWFYNLPHNLDLFIGAPSQQGKKFYNCLYWISCGKIKHVYKKKRLMAFTEYTPTFWKNFRYFENLFEDYGRFVYPEEQSLVFKPYFGFRQHLTCKPLLCSDFFMGRRKELKNKYLDCSFVVIAVNDAIFEAKYIQKLMFLYAKLEAIAKKRDILYVGYFFASFISKNGVLIRI